MRLLSQQLISPQWDRPSEVVAHMGAMQAQDYRMVRWAVGMRTRRHRADVFRKEYDAGDIIRLHLLRGTWQLVAKADYWWMLDLCAPRAVSVIRGWMSANHISISDDEQQAISEIIVDVADAKGSITKEDIALALAEKGVNMTDQRILYHIRLAELNGTLCSGNLLPMKATYALAQNKVPRTDSMSRDEMLMRLARKYFQSHAPATFEDFVWWSGLNVTDCRRGIQLLGPELRCERWNPAGTHGAADGRQAREYTFYIHQSCRTRGFRRGNTLLLPPYDEYLIGYKSRQLVIDAAHMAHAYTNNGIFHPVIAHDGHICGNWSPWAAHLKTSYFTEGQHDGLLKSQWDSFCDIKKSAPPHP